MLESAVGASIITAVCTYLLATRKQRDSTDEKLRVRLHELATEEREGHKECLKEIHGMRSQLTEALVSGARAEAKSEATERNFDSLCRALGISLRRDENIAE